MREKLNEYPNILAVRGKAEEFDLMILSKFLNLLEEVVGDEEANDKLTKTEMKAKLEARRGRLQRTAKVN